MADAATAAVAANKLKSKAAAGGGGGGRAAVAKTTLAGATTRVVERQQVQEVPTSIKIEFEINFVPFSSSRWRRTEGGRGPRRGRRRPLCW